MKHLILLSILTLTFSSCRMIDLNGITNDYDDLSDQYKMMITPLGSFENLNNDFIYEVTGPQLLNKLKSNEKSIVYIFANGCSSGLQLSLDQIEYYAQEYGYELYLVMSDYSSLDATISQSIDSPLFAINTDYYGTNKSRKYQRAFQKDIGYDDFVSEHGRHGSYMFYEGDSLVDLKYSLIP